MYFQMQWIVTPIGIDQTGRVGSLHHENLFLQLPNTTSVLPCGKWTNPKILYILVSLGMDYPRILICRKVVIYIVMQDPFLYLGDQDLSIYRRFQGRNQQSVIASCICPVPGTGGITAQTVGKKPFLDK